MTEASRQALDGLRDLSTLQMNLFGYGVMGWTYSLEGA